MQRLSLQRSGDEEVCAGGGVCRINVIGVAYPGDMGALTGIRQSWHDIVHSSDVRVE